MVDEERLVPLFLTKEPFTDLLAPLVPVPLVEPLELPFPDFCAINISLL